MKMKKTMIGAVLLVASVAGAAPPSRVEYQDRGDRFEGKRGAPVGGTEIELLGATIDGPDLLAAPPENLSLVFFLQDPAVPFVVVRERDDRKQYWMDQVRMQKPPLPRTVNRFCWSTAVLREMRIAPAELTALVRLGYGEPRIRELVAPVQLGPSDAPLLVEAYRFRLRTSRPAQIQARVAGCRAEVVPAASETGRRIPFDLVVRPLPQAPNEKCLLEIAGAMMDNAAMIYQGVEFFMVAGVKK